MAARRPTAPSDRGWAEDYDGWAAAGNAGWSFAEVLPVFLSLESDADFVDEWHGATGPVPVHRPATAGLSTLQRAFVEAGLVVGHGQVADHNRAGAVGVGVMPRNERRRCADERGTYPSRPSPGAGQI